MLWFIGKYNINVLCGYGNSRKSICPKSSGTYRLYFSSTALTDGTIPSFDISTTVKK